MLRQRIEQQLEISSFSIENLQLPEENLPEEFRITVNLDGQARIIRLQKNSVRAASFQVLIQKAGGALHAAPIPPERTYLGMVLGEPGLIAAASLLPEGLHASVVARSGSGWCIRPLKTIDRGASREAHVVFSEESQQPFACGAGQLDPPGELLFSGEPGGRDGDSSGGAENCALKVAEIAFDSDYEFFSRKADSDSGTATSIVETGLNITNLIYVRDVKITHKLTTLVLRSDPAADFYRQFADASNFGAMLSAFREEWNANMGAIRRDVAYFLTGKPNPNLGGLAFVGVVCSSSHYGMGIGGRGYEGIFRHEVGHNWGAGHSCGAERRYIMCGNSIPAISAYNIRVMSAHRDSRSCLDEIPHTSDPEPPYIRLDRVAVLQDEGPIAIDAVAGDTDTNCDQPQLVSFDARSAFGAAILPLAPLRPNAPDALLYLPRADLLGTDSFRYKVVDGTGNEAFGTVLVEIQPRSLIAYLKLDEIAGAEAADSSGFDHTGELRDNLSFDTGATAGRLGGALRFTGVNGEYISLGDDPMFDLTGGLTAAAWFRVDAFDSDGQTIISKGDDAWRVKRDGTTPHLKFTCTGLTVEGSTGGNLPGKKAVSDGEWHHVAGVYDGNRIYLYIDGELDSSLPASGRINTNSSSVRIGDNLWKGAIDEVRLYNFGLNAGAIRALFLNSRTERPDPPHGKAGVIPGSELSWQAAPGVSEHHVYLGTDRQAVENAAVASPEFKGKVNTPSFKPTLAPASAYYWRVDEIVGGAAQKGETWLFTTSFAYTGFSEPPANASNYTPGPAAKEIGFKTVSSPTSGQDPFAGAIATGSTPTSPIFSHRSVTATTTFDAIDLAETTGAAVSIIAQARDTGYEENQDWLEIAVTGGNDKIQLIRLDGGNALTQRAGSGYQSFTATIPPEWLEARLIISSSSNSGEGSERYDFDQVGFFCHQPDTLIAHSYFVEPAVNSASYNPAPGGKELGFKTTAAPTAGANPLAAVVEAGAAVKSRLLTHRSSMATTTFDAVDLGGWRNARATVSLVVADSGYEAADFLEMHATDGTSKVQLVNLTGGNGLNDIAGDVVSFKADIPAGWKRAALVISTSTDSSTGAERFNFRAVEFTSRPAARECSGRAPEIAFRRGDANDDGNTDISDGIEILNYLFLGTAAINCLDAADANDQEDLNITDGIHLLTFLFLGGTAIPPPTAACGADPTADSLTCDSFDRCS
ncbi:MAG: hypothetical protein HY717_20885 [Planctomycetes bacterium]|nr:hypothetical protein [Planctomycetota bacterium]